MAVHLAFLAVLCALLPGTSALCGDHRTCGTCLTKEAREDGCFWCYTDGSCREVGGTPPLINFGGCAAENVTFDSVNCECRPDRYTSCGQCAALAHPSCVWIEKDFEGQLEFYFEATSSGTSYRYAAEPTVFSKGRCWSGNGFGPTHTVANTTFQIGAFKASAQYQMTPTNGWYWAQCTVPEEWMAITIIVLVLGAVVCGCCLCRCMLCSRKLRRNEPVYFNNPLAVQRS